MLFLAVVISFFVAVLILPVLVKVIRSLNLLDAPGKRKVHLRSTPAMGGIAIFLGMLTALLLVVPANTIVEQKFFIGGLFLAFLLGLRDDVISLQAKQKLIVQSLAAFLAVQYANVRIDSLYGVFGITELPAWMSLALTVFVIVALSNSFNLIDGIDGLAGSLTVMGALIFGFWFFYSGNMFFMILCLSLASASTAFLLFNWYPSRIFMGDTGSIFIGFTLSSSAIVFLSENQSMLSTSSFAFESFVSMAIAVLIIPIYDTVRVFALRSFAGGNPMVPDKKHIHHILVKQGFSHGQATLILLAYNIVVLAVVSSFQYLGNEVLLLFLLTSSIAFGYYFDRRLLRYFRAQKELARAHTGIYVSKSA